MNLVSGLAMRLFQPASRVRGLVGARGGRYSLPGPLLVAAGMAVLVIVSSTGPWAYVEGERYVGDQLDAYSVSGTVGDGVFTLIFGIIAGLLILVRLVRPNTTGFALAIVAVLLLISAAIGIGNWTDLSHIPGANQGPKLFRSGFEPGWGLLMMIFAALAGMVAVSVQLWMDELR